MPRCSTPRPSYYYNRLLPIRSIIIAMGSSLGIFFLGINQAVISFMRVVPCVCAVVFHYQLIVLNPDSTSVRIFYTHIEEYAPIHREDLECAKYGTSHNHSQTTLKISPQKLWVPKARARARAHTHTRARARVMLSNKYFACFA